MTAHLYSAAHPSATNKAYRRGLQEGNAGFRPNFMAVGGYDGMHLIYEALKKTGGKADGDSLIAAMKGIAWESPRGPVSIDPDTRDIVQNIYIRKVEKVGGELYNVEFATVEGGAHGAFAMLGGYVTVLLMQRHGVPFLWTIPAAFLVAAFAGLLLERLIYRPMYAKSHLDQVMFSIGLVFMAISATDWLMGSTQQIVRLPTWLQGQLKVLASPSAAIGCLLSSPVAFSLSRCNGASRKRASEAACERRLTTPAWRAGWAFRSMRSSPSPSRWDRGSPASEGLSGSSSWASTRPFR